MKRILYVSSTRRPWFEDQRCAVHYAAAPYSIDAIGYNLEKIGWIVGWCGMKSSCNPFRLAKHIDRFKPDIVYTAETAEIYVMRNLGNGYFKTSSPTVRRLHFTRFFAADSFADTRLSRLCTDGTIITAESGET